jgi:dynein heavy chain
VLDTRETGLLHASERLLSDIFLPALAKTGGWGELSTKHGQQIRQEFINQLQNFVSVLIAAQDSLDDTVVLKECETLDLNEITTPTDYINAANSSDALPKIEELIGVWMKQIEQVRLSRFSSPNSAITATPHFFIL